MGEAQLRGNAMQGDGVYTSADAGTTWRHVGLADTRGSRGSAFTPPTRPWCMPQLSVIRRSRASSAGVYRTRRWRREWAKVLFRDDRTGAVDLALDPRAQHGVRGALAGLPRSLATFERRSRLGAVQVHRRRRHLVRDHPGPGLPDGVIGKIGIAVSGGDPAGLYAVIEARGRGPLSLGRCRGLWTLVNGHRDLWQRSFYFNRVAADPTDRDTVYILNFMLARSTDGGATYQLIEGPHGDYHDLWIDPRIPAAHRGERRWRREVTAQRREDRGRAQRYATAQMYRVETTRRLPLPRRGLLSRTTARWPLPSLRSGTIALPTMRLARS